jgi:hypothetical protein
LRRWQRSGRRRRLIRLLEPFECDEIKLYVTYFLANEVDERRGPGRPRIKFDTEQRIRAWRATIQVGVIRDPRWDAAQSAEYSRIT